MDNTFGEKDCKHFDSEDASCKINKGCGSGSVYCRPAWTGTKCYSLEPPGMVDEFSHMIYAHNDTLVLRGKDGKCWQLTCGDYMGEIPEEELIFVKRAVLSD